VPRIAEVRAPARPSSAEQKERYRRILQAAGRLGAEHGLERMQMHDVAKESGVAIATLYRYFPSKTHLFLGVMRAQVERLAETAERPENGTPAEAVAALLLEAGQRLCERPRLALAMMQSNNAAHADTMTGSTRIDDVFQDLLLRTAGITDPTDDQLRIMRLVEQGWYGVLIGTLNGRWSLSEAEADVRRLCELLLAPLPHAH